MRSSPGAAALHLAGWAQADGEPSGPAADRCAVAVAAVREWSTPERIALAVGALADLSVAARLHATTAALAEVGTDEAVAAVRRAEAERILTDAPVEVAEHAVDRLAGRLGEAARLRVCRTLVHSLGVEERDALLAELDGVPAAGRWEVDSEGPVAAGSPTAAGADVSTSTDGSGVVETGAALALAGRLVDGVAAETLSGAVDDEALRQSVDALMVLGRKVAAERSRRLGEISGRGCHGSRSSQDMLRERYGLTSSAARREVDAARDLSRLPGTREQLAKGQLDPAHAEQAGRALREVDRAHADGKLSDEQAATARKAVDELTASSEPREDATALARRLHDANVAGGAIDLDERDRRAHLARRFWMGDSTRLGEEGMTTLDGALPPAAAQLLDGVLERLARRQGDRDDRSLLQRRADALVELARRASGTRSPSPEARQPRSDDGVPHPADATRAGRDEPAAGDGPTEDGDGSAATDDGLVSTLPPARVLLLTSAAALRGDPDADPSWLDGHGPVGMATARQICCDAEVTLVTLDDSGQPLNVGRTTYNPNASQRKAVIARDRRCVGCGAPARSCQVHHCAWCDRDHGRTDLTNLCLVCQSCHTNVHQFRWRVTVHPDGRYEAHPP